MTPHAQHLKSALEEHAAALERLSRPRPGWVYASPLAFLLTHGQPYVPIGRPPWLPVGVPKACFANALFLAVWFDLQYVEGYGLLALGGEAAHAMPHAWVSNGTGVAWEVTTPAPWLAYFGMPFSVERADDAMWWGDSCVLDDFQRGYPLLRERWTGDKPLKNYRPSPGLRRLRQHKRQGGRLFGTLPRQGGPGSSD